MSNLHFLVHLMQNMRKTHLSVQQDASAAPKKSVRAAESMLSLSADGLDGLPREDISGKITPALLKGLESPDWKGSSILLSRTHQESSKVDFWCSVMLLWIDET